MPDYSVSPKQLRGGGVWNLLSLPATDVKCRDCIGKTYFFQIFGSLCVCLVCVCVFCFLVCFFFFPSGC